MNSRPIVILSLVVLLALLVGLFSRKAGSRNVLETDRSPSAKIEKRSATTDLNWGDWRGRHGIRPDVSAESLVAGMVNHFGRSRRELARAAAERAGLEMPEEVVKFFDAIEAGDWERIEKLWKELRLRSGRYD